MRIVHFKLQWWFLGGSPHLYHSCRPFHQTSSAPGSFRSPIDYPQSHSSSHFHGLARTFVWQHGYDSYPSLLSWNTHRSLDAVVGPIYAHVCYILTCLMGNNAALNQKSIFNHKQRLMHSKLRDLKIMLMKKMAAEELISLCVRLMPPSLIM